AAELVVLLGQHLPRAVATILLVGHLFLVVLFLIGGDQPFLVELVEAGVDVVVVGLLVLLLLDGGGRDFLDLFLLVGVFDNGVLVDEVVVGYVLEVLLIEVLGFFEILVLELLRLIVDRLVVVGHPFLLSRGQCGREH